MAKKAVRNKFAEEPAVVLGLVITVLVSVQGEIAGSDFTWKNVLPVLLAAVLRTLVAPAIPDSVREALRLDDDPPGGDGDSPADEIV